jgi:ribosomal protein L23
MKKKIDYHFKVISHTEYELVLTQETENKVIRELFNKSLLQLQKKGNYKGNIKPEKLETINTFKVDKRFYNFLKTNLKKQYNHVFREVKVDGIELMNYYVKDAYFKRKATNRDKWLITIICNGNYINKRGILR